MQSVGRSGGRGPGEAVRGSGLPGRCWTGPAHRAISLRRHALSYRSTNKRNMRREDGEKNAQQGGREGGRRERKHKKEICFMPYVPSTYKQHCTPEQRYPLPRLYNGTCKYHSFEACNKQQRLTFKGAGQGVASPSVPMLSRYLLMFFISPPPHGIMYFPIYGGLLLLFQGFRSYAVAHPTPDYHIWGAHSEDRRYRYLNPGPPDLQMSALPTELTGRRYPP